MDETLGQSLSPEQSDEAVAELEAMEADYAVLEATEQLPVAPKVCSPSTVAVTCTVQHGDGPSADMSATLKAHLIHPACPALQHAVAVAVEEDEEHLPAVPAASAKRLLEEPLAA